MTSTLNLALYSFNLMKWFSDLFSYYPEALWLLVFTSLVIIKETNIFAISTIAEVASKL